MNGIEDPNISNVQTNDDNPSSKWSINFIIPEN